MSGRGARHHYAHSCIQKLTHAGDDGGTSEQAYFERNTSEMIVGEDPIFRSRGDDPWQLKKDSPCVVLAVGTALNPIWAAGTAPNYPIRAAEKTKVRLSSFQTVDLLHPIHSAM